MKFGITYSQGSDLDIFFTIVEGIDDIDALREFYKVRGKVFSP